MFSYKEGPANRALLSSSLCFASLARPSDGFLGFGCLGFVLEPLIQGNSECIKIQKYEESITLRPDPLVEFGDVLLTGP